MAGKIVQWLGDTFDVAEGYTGPEREIRVDTTNWNLRLHDGSTAGGHVILNQTQCDAKYQPASGEISGISGFGPTDRGFLVRQGDGAYVLRVIASNPNGEIISDNPDGYDGSITLTLADSFVNKKTFENGVVVDNGLTVTGGLESDNLSGSFAGNVNVSSHTFTTDPGQIPAASLNQAQIIALIKTYGSPIGSIMQWDTVTQGAIPAGWAPCDGAVHNGIQTPNMTDKFLVGAGGGYADGATGGVASQNIGVTVGHALVASEMAIHTHVLVDNGHVHGTANDSHTHGLSAPNGALVWQSGSGNALGGSGGQFSPAGTMTVAAAASGITIANAGCNLAINNAGGGNAHTHPTNNFDNRPPYYAVYYIMHVGP
jgi:hypothetical protein